MAFEPLHAVVSLLSLEPGRPGGSETNAQGLLEEFGSGLTGLRTTIVATPRVGEAYRFAAGPSSQFLIVKLHPRAASASQRAIAVAAAPAFSLWVRRVLRERPDVAHYPFTIPVPPIPGARVITLFDLQHHDLPHLWSSAQRHYRRFAYDRAAQTASIVITASRFTQERLVDVLGLSPERVRVIPLGVDHERFKSARDTTDAELEQNHVLPHRFVLYPAAMLAHKNHFRLIDALALTGDRGLALVLTGQHFGRWPALASHADTAGVGHRVKYLGFVKRTLVAALYRRAEAVVFPSLYEGFGAPPLEAMACGTPVASSLAASLGEVCRGAVHALDPYSPESIAEAMDVVVGNTAARATLREAGIRRASGFTWGHAASAHLDAYRAAARWRATE